MTNLFNPNQIIKIKLNILVILIMSIFIKNHFQNIKMELKLFSNNLIDIKMAQFGLMTGLNSLDFHLLIFIMILWVYK